MQLRRLVQIRHQGIFQWLAQTSGLTNRLVNQTDRQLQPEEAVQQLPNAQA